MATGQAQAKQEGQQSRPPKLKPMSLLELPLEIQENILNKLVPAKKKYHKYHKNDRTDLPVLASVCEVWQIFFEQHTFRRLILGINDLDMFAACLEGRYKRVRVCYIQHLHLHVELCDYNCAECSLPENNNTIIDLWTLLSVLATGNIVYRQNQHLYGGITLELSAWSNSDGVHGFKTFRLCQDYPYRSEDDMDENHSGYKHHNWANYNSSSGSPHNVYPDYYELSKRRLFGMPLTMQFDRFKRPYRAHKFPHVSIVKSLLIRRQSYRYIRVDVMVPLLQKSFPRLTSLHLEQWRPDILQNICTMKHDYQAMLAGKGLAHVKEMRIFGDFDAQFNLVAPATNFMPSYNKLGNDLAVATQHMTHVASSFATDATDFLTADNCSWPHLETLALTSHYLQPVALFLECPRFQQQQQQQQQQHQEDGNVMALLVKAAEAAKRMPKLKVMELWFGGQQTAFVFRFESSIKDKHIPRITLLSSWYKIGDAKRAALVAAWETSLAGIWEVVATHGVQLEVSALPSGAPFNTYSGVLPYLELRDRILHPLSQYQVRWEGTNGIA